MTVSNHKELYRLFNGVCITCMRHWRCPKAKLQLNLQHCNAHKLSKLSNEYKKRQEEQNGKDKADKGAV